MSLRGSDWAARRALKGVVDAQGMTPEDAFKNSCESITGPITKTISKQGIFKVRCTACVRTSACAAGSYKW